MMDHPDLAAFPTFPFRSSEQRQRRQILGLVAIAALITAIPERVSAQELTPADAPPAAPTQPRRPRIIGIHFDQKPGWSVGLDGYAGLATLANAEGMKGHALAGGFSRVQISYFELGANLEVSDLVDERWQSVGGFVGAFLPFTNWVDFNAAVGVSSRNWVSKDTRYGPTGASVRVPTLNLRIGVSDRVFDGLLSPRLGAALMLGIDLKHRDVSWSYKIEESEITSGTTRFGGVTLAMVAGFGLDVGKHSQ